MSASPLPYDGEDLGSSPHVAVLFRDQIGDFLVATPLMRGLRERFPGIVLDYFGGDRTRELEEASPLVDARCSLFGLDDGEAEYFRLVRSQAVGPYDLAVNLEGHSLAAMQAMLIEPRYMVGRWGWGLESQPQRIIHAGRPIDGLWTDMRWNRAELLADYPELQSSFIGEIFCRLARVETDYTRTEAPIAEPPLPVPEVLVSTGANRSAKLWPTRHWLVLVGALRSNGRSIGLLGAAPNPDDVYHADTADEALIAAGVEDLRGRLTLPEVAGALQIARAFITVDNGLMHLAAAVNAPTMALFGASPQRLWAPPSPSVRILEPSAPCGACEENRFKNADCLLPVHQCLLSVEPGRVLAATQEMLDRRCVT
jgi:heptosyltransferase III